MLAIAQLAAALAHADGFVPHQVSYELRLDRQATVGGVVSSGGRMDIRYERGCEHWTTNFRFSFTMEMEDGTPVRLGYISRTEESLDGKTYRFEHVETAMDTVVQTIAGTAHRGTGAPPEAIFTSPESRRLRLPPETVFPLAAWRDILDNASQGKNTAGYTLFDGWDTEGPVLLRIWASRAKLDPAGQQDTVADSDLLSGRSWTINSAYFPFGSQEMEPTGNIQERMYDTGVSTPILFDWGEIAIHSEAIAVEALPSPEC